MATVREMREMTNEQLARKLAMFDQRKERNSNYVHRYSTSQHQPYLDEYQRRLLAGKANGHYTNYMSA